MITFLRKRVRRGWAKLTLLSAELVIIIVAFTFSLLSFAYIADLVFLRKGSHLDVAAFSFMARHRSSRTTEIMKLLSFLGSHYFLISANIILIIYFLFIKKQKWYFIKIPAISISSLLIMLVSKQLFHRQRPLIPLLEKAQGLSFPSGHAFMSFTFYGLIIYICWIQIQSIFTRIFILITLLCLIHAIGLSRIYLQVHYASDVIAGFSLGLIWLVLSLAMLQGIENLTKKNSGSIVA